MHGGQDAPAIVRMLSLIGRRCRGIRCHLVFFRDAGKGGSVAEVEGSSA